MFKVSWTFTTSLDIADIDRDALKANVRQGLYDAGSQPVDVTISLVAASTVVTVEATLRSQTDANTAKGYFDQLASSDADATTSLGLPVISTGSVAAIQEVTTQPPPSPPPGKGSDLELLLLLLLILLLIPLLFFVYAKCRFGDKSGDYFKYVFSHSNPFFVIGYIPKERRQELADSLFRASSSDDSSSNKEDLPVGAPGPSSAPKGKGDVEKGVDDPMKPVGAPGPSSAPAPTEVERI